MEERISVKGARQLAGYSQREMADKLGVHMQTYRKLEREPQKMTVHQAFRFCNIVQRSFVAIFFDEHSS